MICHQLNLIILIWELVNFLGVVSEKTCALDKLFDCPDGESCEQIRNSTSLGVCKCKNNYTRISPDSACLSQVDIDHPSLPTPTSTSESAHSQGASVSAIVGGLITAILLIALAVSLVFAAKKYRWVHRVREKAQSFRVRHYDTVLVSQEDDPPLA